jgi:(p)ppGpp synthase/HD superfamily hydrolase
MDALRFAADRHAGQKYGGIDGLPSYPYIHHCASVVIILQQFGVTDEDILMAGACHDVLEDTNTTAWEVEKAIGKRAAEIVELVSNPHEQVVYMQNGIQWTKLLYEYESCEFGEIELIENKKLSRKEKHEIQYPKIATDEGAVLVKLADRIANVETGGKIEMYRKEYEFFRKTIRKQQSKMDYLNSDLGWPAYCMWEWLDEKMEWGLTNTAA